jgi:hypothetical protein
VQHVHGERSSVESGLRVQGAACRWVLSQLTVTAWRLRLPDRPAAHHVRMAGKEGQACGPTFHRRQGPPGRSRKVVSRFLNLAYVGCSNATRLPKWDYGKDIAERKNGQFKLAQIVRFNEQRRPLHAPRLPSV